MRAVSAALTQALTGSHRMKSRARVVTPGQTGVDPDGVEIGVQDGTVRFDATAEVRATLDLATDGSDWDPRYGRDPRQPYGNEIFIERGVQVSGGSTEWVSQGYFRMYSVGQDQAPKGQLRIPGQDRWSAIIDARLLAPRQFTAARLASSAIEELVLEVLPDTVIDFNVPDRTLGRAQVAEDDRAAFLRDIADALAAVIYYDHRGHLVIDPAPSPTADPVWTVAGGDGGVLVRASRTLTRDGVFNVVVATGEAADDAKAVRAVAYDNNPSSATYWKGPYGQVPRFYSSPLLTTNGQAASAASALLTQSIGLPYNLDFDAIPHPGLEDRDIVRVEYDSWYDNHAIDSLVMPLTARQAMSATTRRQDLIAIGTVA